MAEHRVASLSKIPEGKAWPITVDDYDIMLVRFGDMVYAIEDCCSHQEFPLSQGEIDSQQCTVRCRAHGATFDLRTGKAMKAPAFAPVPVYNVRVEGDDVFVEIED
ncbi:non-heme iron oxygenase ferredoxin subunit [bacterium]|nr:non-heme iron oxygenase ferredoxin subunit [bacterium]MCB1220893.1 non-heme iron oxygenase ferredoxin subunit [bacterium]UNM07609.1 MAG: non-heme iron oxygenase ferredoxin subunit [Planctomycetales bacterium]